LSWGRRGLLALAGAGRGRLVAVVVALSKAAGQTSPLSLFSAPLLLSSRDSSQRLREHVSKLSALLWVSPTTLGLAGDCQDPQAGASAFPHAAGRASRAAMARLAIDHWSGIHAVAHPMGNVHILPEAVPDS